MDTSNWAFPLIWSPWPTSRTSAACTSSGGRRSAAVRRAASTARTATGGGQVDLELATLEHRVREKTTHNPPLADLPAGAEIQYSGDFTAGIGVGGGVLDLALPDGRHTVHVRADKSTRPALIERGSYGLMLVQFLRDAEIKNEVALGDGHVDWLEPGSGDGR